MGHIRPEDYNTALEVQCAVNLQAVLKSFDDILTRISAEAHEKMLGTDWKNRHPICRLFVEQISYLTTKCSILGDSDGFNKAYQECLNHSTSACQVTRPPRPSPEWRKRIEEEIKKWRRNPSPIIPSPPAEKVEEIIHGLSSGRAFCGFPGIPQDWPEGHTWIDLKTMAGKIACPKCIEVLKNVTKGN